MNYALQQMVILVFSLSNTKVCGTTIASIKTNPNIGVHTKLMPILHSKSVTGAKKLIAQKIPQTKLLKKVKHVR